jgi:hypothetical protein
VGDLVEFDGRRKREFDGGGGNGQDSAMEARLKALEIANTDARERLARIETKLDHVATKADVSGLESTLLKWFIGTACTLTGLAFAAAKLIN